MSLIGEFIIVPGLFFFLFLAGGGGEDSSFAA